MEELINQMVEKVGIDKATAEKVFAFLKDHKEDALKALESSAVKDHLPAGLADKLGSLF